jgi:hypothetical protein
MSRRRQARTAVKRSAGDDGAALSAMARDGTIERPNQKWSSTLPVAAG